MPSAIAAILIGAVGGVIVVYGNKFLFSRKKTASDKGRKI